MSHRSFAVRVLALLASGWLGAPTPGRAVAAPAAAEVDFATEVLPLFESRCLGCHGPQQQMSGLRLDLREAALGGGKSGPAIVPGRGADSLLYRKVAGTAPGSPMPLSGDKLTPAQLETVRAWIDQGARWPEGLANRAAPVKKHWAYVKPVRPEVPAVTDRAWVRNPIDAFVLARLEREGLRPAPEATREHLIRRVTLDLTGLPPTPDEVAAFVADRAPDAYEKVVDRLLASPRYGERWARPWLDLARYADTGGYIHDRRRSMWPYRDWVIRSLNADMPFDQFTVEQIAGDLLPSPTLEQQVATGFHRNTMVNTEGGTDPEEYRVAAILDRIDTTATVWLGSTLACAQCHDHKYNPFTQEEYYRFFAFFNNTEQESSAKNKTTPFTLKLAPPDYLAGYRTRLEDEIVRQEAALAAPSPEVERGQARWEAKARPSLIAWTPLEPAGVVSAGGATLTRLEDGSILAGGTNPDRESYVVTARTELAGITGLRLEALTHPSLPGGGSGRAADSNFVLTELEVSTAPAGSAESTKQVAFAATAADHEQSNFEVAKAVDDNPATGWAVEGHKVELRMDRQAVFTFAQPVGAAGGTELTVRLRHESDRPGAILGRFRLSVTTAAAPGVKLPLAVERIVACPAERRTAEQRDQLARYYRSIAPELEPARTRLAQLREVWGQVTSPTVLVMREKEPRKTHVFLRGSFLNPGKEVTAGVPAVFPPLPKGEPPNRLGLARWLVDRDNPLVGRVTANRFWMDHFGRGLVATPEDFGSQGARPSHPELLDWLATELVTERWSLKKFHRLIVTSATYRQSARMTPLLRERDLDNELYARGPRFRMDAEMIRDNALQIAGLLSPTMYGPSVFPPQPDGLWDDLYVPDHWTTSGGEDRYRRGLYTFWKRIVPYPFMVAFDAPTRETVCVRRTRTNTPLQALNLFNDPVFLEASRALARRLTTEGGAEVRDRIIYGFRLCVARRPAAAELDEIVRLFSDQRAHFARQPDAARQAVAGDPRVSAAPAIVAEAAAWTTVAHALLNLDETITRP